MHLIEGLLAEAAVLSAVRRDIHAHPELGYNEHRTANLIATLLSGWGIRVHRGLGKTGIVGVIEGRAGTRAVGLRADMDALPITECNTFEHVSVHAGRMHACGHDGHTAMLLAAAQHLSRHRDFDGTVYLIFQPAEEGGAGARTMIEDGLFERFSMQAIFGVHNWPGLGVGQFAVKAGPIAASGNRFRVLVRGKGAHAAMPHDGVDPLLVACQVVQGFQTIVTRNKRPIDTAVISVTMIHGGEATNVIPECCEIRGTVRTFSVTVLEMIERRMEAIATSSCAAFDASGEFEFERYYPATINHAAETAFVRSTLNAMVGESNVVEFEGTMSSEDFGFYLKRIPGCYFLIGNGDGAHQSEANEGVCMLHNPNYDFNDALVALGGSMWVRLIEAWFS